MATLSILSIFFASGCGKFGYDPTAVGDDEVNGADSGRDVRGDPLGMTDAASVVDSTGVIRDAATRDGGACNCVPNARLIVPETKVATSLPTPAGGTIGDGRYYLVKREVFTGFGGAAGPTGHTYREAIELTTINATQDPWHLVVRRVRNIDGTREERETLIATPVFALPNSLTKNPSCGSSRTTTLSYLATRSTLVLFDPEDFSASTFRWDGP